MSIAWPFDGFFVRGQTLWWLQIGSLSAFVLVLRSLATPRAAFLASWLFATAWLGVTFNWLFGAMHTYGGMAAPLAAGAVVLLAAALGLYYAIAGWLWFRVSRPTALSALLFAAVWTGAEMARSLWLTGFGWGAIGYAHLQGPLRGLIPWVGVFGVSFVAAWMAALMATVFARPGRIALLVAAMAGLTAMIPPDWNDQSQPNGSVSVALLQGNIPQDEKFETGTGIPLALAWYAEQLAAHTADLLVAPETAIPVLPRQLPEGYWDAIRQRFTAGPSAVMLGIPLGSYDEGYSNSVIAFTPGTPQAWRYDKHHLVPFGEFIPPLFHWFTQLMQIPLGDFNRGALGQPSLEVAGQRFAANICYEDLFGEELATRFQDPRTAPTVFVNVGNIAWFGDSMAIDQHLNISKMRALEFQRPFVRATNTGATVIMDHRAEVQASLPRLTRGVLVGRVEGRTGMTPYAAWVSRFGTWPLWIVCAVVVLVAHRPSARPRR